MLTLSWLPSCVESDVVWHGYTEIPVSRWKVSLSYRAVVLRLKSSEAGIGSATIGGCSYGVGFLLLVLTGAVAGHGLLLPFAPCGRS